MKRAVFFAMTVFLFPFSSASTLSATVPKEGSYFDFRKIAKESMPAVVSIQVAANGKQEGVDPAKDPFWGRFFGKKNDSDKNAGSSDDSSKKTLGQASGFFVSKDGYIVTNSHVVKQADEIVVILQDNSEIKAALIGFDANTDIGLIKIEGDNYPFLKLGDSSGLEAGEWVMAIGAPLGLRATVTVGVVSAVDRNNLDLAKVEDFIQTDVAINEGNSGGPLLDLTGEVVGMNTAIVTNSDGGGYMGIGFAIPSNLIRHIYPILKDKGAVSRGYLGVTLKKVDEPLAKSMGLKGLEGAVISEVTADSPAEKAGLKPGDIVTELEGREIKDTAMLRNGVQMLSPGTPLQIKVLREGKPLYIKIELATFPENPSKRG